jgi:Lrp/AsnC family leucine-responsive transcriptional regulator
MPSQQWDKIDRAILRELQRDGRIANVDLAERVALSPSACLRRTKALEAAGVISGYRAELGPAAIGLGLTVFVSLRVEQHSRQTSREVEQALLDIPAVVACHVISGEADFLIEAVVPDLAAWRPTSPSYSIPFSPSGQSSMHAARSRSARCAVAARCRSMRFRSAGALA